VATPTFRAGVQNPEQSEELSADFTATDDVAVRCTPKLLLEIPSCARAASDIVRRMFAALHDGQIAALIEAGEEERMAVVRRHMGPRERVAPEAALTAPRPLSTTFDSEERGTTR